MQESVACAVKSQLLTNPAVESEKQNRVTILWPTCVDSKCHLRVYCRVKGLGFRV